ncbi:type II toxin-antitoxin system VapC family toxin [Streptosporangium amethystogenes]|uniref:type II toxin-antitoxin system VapC family toxin n=1 Tax=Streptosporangium amethystogenes TaxID=2002 RepID=UPI00068B9E1B|nr:type II toxin-antitoxin system VapC family toxin [Streptosporangium amethystogenes]
MIISKPEVRISEARGRIMLERYAQLRIVRHPMRPLQPRVLELRDSLTAFDGMYVALAQLLGMPLLTDDAKFTGATGHRAENHRSPRCRDHDRRKRERRVPDSTRRRSRGSGSNEEISNEVPSDLR